MSQANNLNELTNAESFPINNAWNPKIINTTDTLLAVGTNKNSEEETNYFPCFYYQSKTKLYLPNISAKNGYFSFIKAK